MPGTTCQRVCAILLLVLGVVLIVLAIAGKQPINSYIDNLIIQEVIIKPDTSTYRNWRIPPVYVYDDIYLFNITNPTEFNNGSKAVLDMVGPFVYRKNEVKLQPNFTGNLEFAMYYDAESYLFDEMETLKVNTKTTLNDTIFIPNLPLLTVASLIAHSNIIPSGIKRTLEEFVELWEKEHGIDGLTLNGTIYDILWGMDDPIMKKLYQLKLAPTPQLALQTNGSTDPDALTKQTVVYTGYTDISRVDEYALYHGRNSSGCWGSDAANRINGTEGTMFQPLLVYNKSRSVVIYNEQLFRSVDLDFVVESTYGGVTCYQYKIPDWALQNMQNNPINEAYYAYVYSGMLNLTQCSSNVPLYITKMLFLDADPRILDNITLSIQANRSLHDTYLCIEPYTGAVIDGHKRVQMNVQIEQQPTLGILSKAHPAFVPLLNIDEHGSITTELTKQLKKDLLTPILLVHISFYILLSLGTILLLSSLVIHVRILISKYRGKEEDSQILVVNEENSCKQDNIEQSVPSDQYLSFDGRTSRIYYDPDS